jgi:anaerobic selenocysteine-containing dehydrogenase
MLVNLLLLRGTIGKPGAGLAPVCGACGAQDRRSIGGTTRLTPLEKLAQQYGFDPTHRDGLATTDAGDGLIKGARRIKGVLWACIGLGGNLLRAERLMEEAWKKLRLSMHVTAKPKRTPAPESDEPAIGPQEVPIKHAAASAHPSPDDGEPVDPDAPPEPDGVDDREPDSLDPQIVWDPDVFMLVPLHGDGRFNPALYGGEGRFRGVFGRRDVVMMNAEDMAALRLKDDDRVTLVTEAWDGYDRRLSGLQVVPYPIPRGCIAGYYPECNGLIPLWHYAEEFEVPSAKPIPVRIVKQATA